MKALTNITFQKNVLIHFNNKNASKAVKYSQLVSELKGVDAVSVSCISANMERRIKTLTSNGFDVVSVTTPVSDVDELAFAEYVLERR